MPVSQHQLCHDVLPFSPATPPLRLPSILNPSAETRREYLGQQYQDGGADREGDSGTKAEHQLAKIRSAGGMTTRQQKVTRSASGPMAAAAASSSQLAGPLPVNKPLMPSWHPSLGVPGFPEAAQPQLSAMLAARHHPQQLPPLGSPSTTSSLLGWPPGSQLPPPGLLPGMSGLEGLFPSAAFDRGHLLPGAFDGLDLPADLAASAELAGLGSRWPWQQQTLQAGTPPPSIPHGWPHSSGTALRRLLSELPLHHNGGMEGLHGSGVSGAHSIMAHAINSQRELAAAQAQNAERHRIQHQHPAIGRQLPSGAGPLRLQSLPATLQAGAPFCSSPQPPNPAGFQGQTLFSSLSDVSSTTVVPGGVPGAGGWAAGLGQDGADDDGAVDVPVLGVDIGANGELILPKTMAGGMYGGGMAGGAFYGGGRGAAAAVDERCRSQSPQLGEPPQLAGSPLLLINNGVVMEDDGGRGSATRDDEDDDQGAITGPDRPGLPSWLPLFQPAPPAAPAGRPAGPTYTAEQAWPDVSMSLTPPPLVLPMKPPTAPPPRNKGGPGQQGLSGPPAGAHVLRRETAPAGLIMAAAAGGAGYAPTPCDKQHGAGASTGSESVSRSEVGVVEP